ncbi:hypothetical protein FRC06_000394 [Ceratobasidium sp. 370]|nr:hypothetical protein FRC06_000394 [Ceratobasidium sp. 370]
MPWIIPPSSRISAALRFATHGLLDVPLPIGILHAWMTALEIRMNDLVTRLSAEYHRLERSILGSTLLVDSRPFGVAFEKAWLTFAAWCGIGFGLSVLVFIMMVATSLVKFGLFMLSVIVGVVFNFKYSDGDLAASPEDIFAAYGPDVVVCEPEAAPQPESEPAPPTPQAGPSYG